MIDGYDLMILLNFIRFNNGFIIKTIIIICNHIFSKHVLILFPMLCNLMLMVIGIRFFFKFR